MRRTKDPRIALARMLEAFPEVTVVAAGARVSPLATVKGRPAAKQLAKLAFLARFKKRDDVRAKVRWVGIGPFKGVKGWEEESLWWLRVDR